MYYLTSPSRKVLYPHWVLFDRKLLIHLRTFPCIPRLYNFVKRRSWGTVSKARLKSKYKVSTGRDESIYCDHWSKISSNCITQDITHYSNVMITFHKSNVMGITLHYISITFSWGFFQIFFSLFPKFLSLIIFKHIWAGPRKI
jgi:hypothetical protein